jgi:hypothetical protein
MKQTAIEWLVEQMLYPEFANPYIEQAKEMEKEQIIDAYQSDRFPCSEQDAEQYYNENFGK